MNKSRELLNSLIEQVQSCDRCIENLPHGARPVIQVGTSAKILIAGQAPGSKVHATGIPFDDPSGDRLRQWMGVDKTQFYDANQIAILPMGFCYPGKGKSGDLPPTKECADLWRKQLLELMPKIELTLVIGQYAIAWHLPQAKKESLTNKKPLTNKESLTNKKSLTNTVKDWRAYWPSQLPLPHPSPRNNIWLKKNDWFEAEIIPLLQERVKSLLD